MTNSKKNKTNTKNTKLPPMSKDEVELNQYGNCYKTPRGWILTEVPQLTFQRHGIHCVEIYQRNTVPRLIRAYHPDDKVRIYRREKSGTIIPRIEEIAINRYGNCDGAPYRWVKTSLTKPQLNRIKIPFVKAVVEWSNYGALTEKYIHPKDEGSALAYKPRQQNRQNRQRAIEQYASYMTDCEDEQESIIYEYDNNRATRGKAWKLMSEGYRQKDKGLMKDAYRMMKGARHRHQYTNYDDLLRQGYDRDSARLLKV